MKYRYTKFTGDALDDLDLEDLVSKLSDLLLSSGFGNPYAMDDEERTMQALHDAILDALFNGGVLPEETIERLLGHPLEQLELLLGPLAVTRHRTLAQALEDRRGVILHLVVGRQIERPSHGLKVRRAEQRLDVLLEAHPFVSGGHNSHPLG